MVTANPPIEQQTSTVRHGLLFDSLSKALSDQADLNDWSTFSEVDWGRLALMARAEGVAPLLHWRLKQPGGTSIPAPPVVRQALARAYYQSAAHSTLLFNELGHILTALNLAGIPVIVLKGAALAGWLYEDPALRPMHDLDLQVRPGDLVRVVDCLRRLGYSQEKVTYHVVMRGDETKPISVEVHWSLMPGVEEEEFFAGEWPWTHSEPLGLRAGRLIRGGLQLDPTASLIYLAAHLAIKERRNPERLIWLMDLDRLVRSCTAEIDWPVLPEQAGRLGWAAGVQTALASARGRLGTPLPAETMTKLAANGGQSHLPDAQDWTRSALRALSWPARLRVLWGLAVPSRAYLRWRYLHEPGWAWPVAYVRRWRDLLRQAL